jgi:transcriptional regulator with XRE-family HTH domain
MRLQDYLASNSLSRADFAQQIGVSVESVRRYLNGRVPEPSVMGKIIWVTDGEVTANDFFQLPTEEAA